MPGRQLWTDADGVRVRYFLAGQGPPVLLLHGLGEAAIVWHANVDVMASRHTVIALDIPGHGASDKPEWRYSLEKSTQFLLAFLDALQLDRVSLVGNSMGGLMSLAVALDHPERVHKLVLVDTAGLGREVASFLRLMSVPVVGELMARPTEGSVRWTLRRMFYDRGFVTPQFVEALHQERRIPGNKGSMLRILRYGVNIFGMRPHALLASRLPQLKASTLTLWGRQDTIFPASHADQASLLPNNRLHTFDECGHWPHIEKREEFNRLVLEFLRV
jgi:pimeloyl-ACP methyl ester carboxylesterase